MTLNSNWLRLEIFWTIYEAHYQIVSTILYYLLTHIFSYGSPVLHKTCKCDKHTTVHLRKKKSSSPQNVTIIQSFQNWLKKKEKKQRQYFCKHASSSILSQPHEDGEKSKREIYSASQTFRKWGEVSFWHNISHIFKYIISRYGWKSKRATGAENASFPIP